MQLRDLERIFVYHSPQVPGFTCWLGLWNMPDESVMCSFIQATGPLTGRSKATDDVREYLTWPPEGHGDEYDMTGLDLRHVHLRSTDFGRTWQLVSADPFRSPMNGAPGEVEDVIPDAGATWGGVIVRGVWGAYLPYDEGETWTHFDLTPETGARDWARYFNQGTPYYPKAVQMANREILVLGHMGGDDGYGMVDQSVVGLRFRVEP